MNSSKALSSCTPPQMCVSTPLYWLYTHNVQGGPPLLNKDMRDGSFHPDYLWIVMVPKWISTSWSHLPSRKRHKAPASHCPFVKMHIILGLSELKKKVWDISQCQQGNAVQVWLSHCCQTSFRSVSRGLCAASPFLTPHSPADLASVHSVISPLTQDKENHITH